MAEENGPSKGDQDNKFINVKAQGPGAFVVTTSDGYRSSEMPLTFLVMQTILARLTNAGYRMTTGSMKVYKDHTIIQE